MFGLRVADATTARPPFQAVVHLSFVITLKDGSREKKMDHRFKRVEYPVWYGEGEKALASKILDENPDLIPYQAVVAVNKLCSDGTSPYSFIDKSLKFEAATLPTRPGRIY